VIHKNERAQLPHYQRPYYEYKIELAPAASEHTIVESQGECFPGTKIRKANPAIRLWSRMAASENDLLICLADYLANNDRKSSPIHRSLRNDRSGPPAACEANVASRNSKNNMQALHAKAAIVPAELR